MVVPDGGRRRREPTRAKKPEDLPAACFSAEGKFLDGEGSFSRRVRGRVRWRARRKKAKAVLENEASRWASAPPRSWDDLGQCRRSLTGVAVEVSIAFPDVNAIRSRRVVTWKLTTRRFHKSTNYNTFLRFVSQSEVEIESNRNLIRIKFVNQPPVNLPLIASCNLRFTCGNTIPNPIR